MAGGITPNKVVTIPLGDYNPDYYLTLLYQSMLNQGWHIGYFNHDGIIAYTNISWASYSEEISARIKESEVIIKSECVGYQGLFTDYGKNRKNLELLFGEITYSEFHLQHDLEQTTQALMDAVPENQFLNPDDPPMAGKEQLRGFWSPIIPKSKYLITPLLVIINTVVYISTSILFMILSYRESPAKLMGTYMLIGVNNREAVLNGQIWRLLTSTFLHFSLLHLVSNMIVLVYIGSLIESKLGKWNFLLLYLFTGIAASTASVIWRSTGISAGASGAIFGLFGILLALLSTNFYEQSARRALLISTGIFVAYNIIPFGDEIDHAAHFGGLISGYILGWVAFVGLRHRNSVMRRYGIALAGFSVVFAFVSLSFAFIPNYQIDAYKALIKKANNMVNTINTDFYYTDVRTTREEKLKALENKTLPELNDFKSLAPQFDKLLLPAKMKTNAKDWAQIIKLQNRYYLLVYLKYKERDSVKYQPMLDSLTQQQNIVRYRMYTN